MRNMIRTERTKTRLIYSKSTIPQPGVPLRPVPAVAQRSILLPSTPSRPLSPGGGHRGPETKPSQSGNPTSAAAPAPSSGSVAAEPPNGKIVEYETGLSVDFGTRRIYLRRAVVSRCHRHGQYPGSDLALLDARAWSRRRPAVAAAISCGLSTICM